MLRKTPMFIPLIVASSLSTIACDESELVNTEADVLRSSGVDQSFLAPEPWAHELTLEFAWREQHPRMLADVNGDTRQDIVGFGDDGVWLAPSTGSSFEPQLVLFDFGTHQGWWYQRHVRTVGDIDNDGRADVVGFGEDGVWRALAVENGFGEPELVGAHFAYQQGWRVDKHVRMLADVNGDGSQDIVGFGEDGVWLSLATGDGNFQPEPALVISDLGFQQGWDPDLHIRTTADVNGDGMQDVVGFGEDGVWLSLSEGNSFGTPQLVLQDFCWQTGWRTWDHKRLLADVNNDERDDIVGFGEDYVWLALSNGTGFDPIVAASDQFAWGAESRYPRFVTDLNGDGFVDLLGLGPNGVTRALGGSAGFAPAQTVLRAMTVGKGWSSSASVYPRMIGDVDGNGMTDLVGFDYADIKVALSTDLPPGEPPAAPSNLQVIDATDHSLTIAWDDNSDDELRFLIDYHPVGGTTSRSTRSPDTSESTISFLEPDTEYCFEVRAENLWDVSEPTDMVCDRTKEQTEEPPNPPPEFGVRRVDVYNCNSDYRDVHVWTKDLAQGYWVERGTASSLWQGGSCPGNGLPFTVNLEDGHDYWFVVVDPDLIGCDGQNNPEATFCQRSYYGAPLHGLGDGPVLVNVVN
jgi:hypothetical protein